jgi:hypothetical protein
MPPDRSSSCNSERAVQNTTLFSDIQRLFERTYAAVGINLEDCLIDQASLRAAFAARWRDCA